VDDRLVTLCSPKINGGTRRASRAKISMTVRVHNSGEPMTADVCGRDAWALQSLLRAGAILGIAA
jgi:hypothetical protein